MEPKKNENKTALKDSTVIEFVPFGATDKIKLSATMIRDFVAVPTRSGAMPSARDCVRFLMLCRGKRANPFEGDCYLIGYDSQNGPSFSIVCGIELFLKRAESSEDYDGNETGVIISSAEGIIERQGAIVYKNETLEGGWAKVYRKDRNHPVYKAVKFATYDTGKSRWIKDPGGQIAKVALSQALRDAYPTAIGGLYTQEEMQRITESGDGVAILREPIAMPKEIPTEAARQKSAELSTEESIEIAGKEAALAMENDEEPPFKD
jgi:phage recombination protein Bet